MRLIDADAIEINEECTFPSKGIKAFLDAIPTAFDVDKVMERLGTELRTADDEKERCARENQLQFDTAKGYAHGISVVLEIVKSGGIE